MRFIVTQETGKLARWLRILGFDTVYFTEHNLSRLVIQALREKRIIITRYQGPIGNLEKNTIIIYAEDIKSQLKDLIQRLELKIDRLKMFTRCAICNEPLHTIKKQAVRSRIAEHVYKKQNDFRQCPGCHRLYWQGSHWGNINKALEEIL